jgi:hypothetical protein
MESNENLDIIHLDNPFTYNYEPIGLKCPYCGIIKVNDDEFPNQCEHIVFSFDWTNGVYEDVSSNFLKYLKHHFSFRDKWENVDEIDKESIEDFLSAGIVPPPEFLRDWIQYLRLFEMYYIDGGHGFIWGHASKRLIQKINKVQEKFQ